MALLTTANTDQFPHAYQGQASELIYFGVGNLKGETLGNITQFPVTYSDWPPKATGITPVNQIVGLVQLTDCDDTECREYTESPYINPVLASLTETDPYYNDINTFLISFSGWYSLIYTTTIKLQESVADVWTDIAPLTDDTYGTMIDYNDYTDHPDYTGYVLEWAEVLDAFGAGIYRIKFEISGGAIDMCATSEPFCLKEWSCDNARNTVKFEMTLNGGTIGSTTNPAQLFNLCGILHTDSIRFEGFFGYEKANSERRNIEYNNGIIFKVRDEFIKIFELQTGRLPKWLHDRFKAYALMADTLLVSDYNHNNADYNIKRKGVVCDSGYEPAWVQYSRYARVRVQFKENQQNLIRRRCCPGRK